jgi:hypothetical protein
MKLPQELVYNIVDIIISRNDADTLFNLYTINKVTNYYINKQKEKYKIDKSLMVYLRRYIKSVNICSNCGIYMFGSKCTYQHNTQGVINLCTRGFYNTDISYVIDNGNFKCDPIVVTRKCKRMGGILSEMHPSVKTQIEKYKCNNLFLLNLFDKYLLQVFFNDISLYNKISNFLNKINYKELSRKPERTLREKFLRN